jgi:hypothetical protein
MAFRVRTEFSGMQGSPWLSTMFFNQNTGTEQQCVDAVGAFWSAVDALMDNEVNWATLPDVEDVNSVTGQVVGVATTTPATGTGGTAGESLPPATQALVRWRTGVYSSGREIRGRTFIPALVEQNSDNGQVLAAAQTTINNAAAALIADANTILEIWSRVNGASPSVVSGSCWSQFAVLRSRRD